MDQVVMVDPVHRDIKEADDVADEDGPFMHQGVGIGTLWALQLQHHDGEDDGDHTIGEGLQPSR